MPIKKRIWILGSTGSIGRQTLEVVESCPDHFEVVGLSAHRNFKLALEQAEKFRVSTLALTHPKSFETAKQSSKSNKLRLVGGENGLHSALSESSFDLVVQAITGAAGLPYSMIVLEKGKTLALANKESLVIAGSLLMKLAKQTGASVIPIDSEHCAIFQCIGNTGIEKLRRIYLTGSGGALRDFSLNDLETVTPEQALKHPNWSMGERITIDSATMMNKAFEILEAVHLFGISPDQIQVLLHPQSIIHSMVEFVDGSIMAQLGIPDMRVPIHYALHYPQRVESPLQGFDPVRFRQLNFETPDTQRYPALELGTLAGKIGGVAGAVLNAADEVAVSLFLEKQIRFPQIGKVCKQVLEKHPRMENPNIEQILEADRWAREQTRQALVNLS